MWHDASTKSIDTTILAQIHQPDHYQRTERCVATTHTQTHTAPSECSACSTATNQVYGRRKRRTFVRKWSIYLLVFAHYLNPFFSLYSQILCPILTAINDKCYDTIKPSRLHITAAIKVMILSTTSIRCALVIPASCYSARTRIPNQNVYPLYPIFVYVCVCVCATGMESVCAARIQQERRTSHTCNGNTVACAVRCKISNIHFIDFEHFYGRNALTKCTLEIIKKKLAKTFSR